MSVPPLAAHEPLRPQLSCCSKLYQLTEIVTQIAIRVIFIAGSILMAAAALPLQFHAIGIPVVAFGTTVLAGFFFPQKRRICPPFFGSLPPLLQPILGNQGVQAPGNLPADAPRGLVNLGMNCAFNSLVHYLESDPQIAHFLRHPLAPDIDMAGFQNFLAGYHPTPRLMADFDAYVAAQNPPRPIPTMFSDFMGQYMPPLAEHNSFRKIQEVYRNINLLHGPYSHFLADYDQAVRENRFSLAGTQQLRLATNRITAQISDSEWHQEDAPEILTQVLNVLPDAHKVKIEQATHYQVGDHPIAELPDAISRKEDRIEYFTLEIKESQQTAQLEQLFHQFCDYDVEHHPTYKVEADGVRFPSADGQIRRYKHDHCTIRILEAPTALRFQIKRFDREKEALQSWWSWLLPSWFPVIGPRTIKRDIPVEAPEELTITLANGERRRYQLASFINQHGNSIDSGHYTACRIVNGQKYIMDDQSVTLADQQAWDAQLRQAYLLCYVPVP